MIHSPAVSPDTRRLVFYGYGSQIRIGIIGQKDFKFFAFSLASVVIMEKGGCHVCT